MQDKYGIYEASHVSASRGSETPIRVPGTSTSIVSNSTSNTSVVSAGEGTSSLVYNSSRGYLDDTGVSLGYGCQSSSGTNSVTRKMKRSLSCGSAG